jgi:signal transduction histidine kinase
MVVILILGTFIMLTIAIIVISFVVIHGKKYQQQQRLLCNLEFTRQQDVFKAVVRTQEEERSRIASSIHDSIGAELSMLKLNLSKYAYFLKKSSFDSSSLVADITALDNTILELRSICRDLYPISLMNYGFIKTFEELMSRINTAASITCKYKINIQEEDIFPDLNLKLNLLRIIQEIVNNLIKHAGCTYLDIGFILLKSDLNIVFNHNGQGFNNKEATRALEDGKGLGLFSINNRIELMEGKIDYLGKPNGSEIIITIPVSHE